MAGVDFGRERGAVEVGDGDSAVIFFGMVMKIVGEWPSGRSSKLEDRFR